MCCRLLMHGSWRNGIIQRGQGQTQYLKSQKAFFRTQGARGADSQGIDRERGTGKALFTSPVLNQQILSRPLEPIEDTEVTLDLAQPEDVNGRSPTAAL